MAANYDIDENGVFIRPCSECRGLGYVVDLIGEVRRCSQEECVKKRAVEVLEEGQEGKDRGASPKDFFDGDVLGGLLKGNPEFKKLAGSFVMGGLAGVVAKLGSDIIAEAAKKEEKTKGSKPLLPPLLGPPPSRATRRAKKPSRRRSR